jgi:hypothetical protein
MMWSWSIWRGFIPGTDPPPCHTRLREAAAPVRHRAGDGPRTWPNSSLSRSVAGSAVQFTATNGSAAYGELS